ncbi:MAG: DUF1641 domain-containing protein [Myxococcota bacterium]
MDDTDLDTRLSALEDKLSRVLEHLQASGNRNGSGNGNGNGHGGLFSMARTHGNGGSGGLVTTTAREVEEQLVAVHGEAEMRAQLAEAFLRLSEPEALESLTRIAALAPKVEYAVQAVAAGPELLEDGLRAARELAAGRGEDLAAVEERLQAIGDVLLTLTAKEPRDALLRVGLATPKLVPLVEGAATGAAQLADVEGNDALTERIADAVTRIAEPTTLESLTMLAELAPRLEFAAQAAAAAPALLEDALGDVRMKLEARGRTETATIDDAADVLLALSQPKVLRAVTDLSNLAPHLAGLAGAVSCATVAHSNAEGELAFQDRISEAVREATDPEVLDSLVRVIQLVPRLEFAVQALAATPALLEDAMALTREKLEAEGVHDLDARVDAGLVALVTLTQPKTLEAVSGLAALAPSLGPLVSAAGEAAEARASVHGAEVLRSKVYEATLELTDPETLDSLIRLIQLVPRLEFAVQAVAATPALLEDAMALVQEKLGDDAAIGIEPRVAAGADTLLALSEPASLEAIQGLGALAPEFMPLVEAAAAAARDRMDVQGRDALRERVYEATLELTDPEVLDAVVRIAQLTPRLEFAVQAAAAAPALLEDLARAVREQVGDDVDARAEQAIEVVKNLATPDALRALTQLTAFAPKLANDRTLGALEKLAEEAPSLLSDANLALIAKLAKRAPKLLNDRNLDALEAAAGRVPELLSKPTLDALTRLTKVAPKVSSPEVIDAIVGLTKVAPVLGKKENLDALTRVVEASPELASKETLDAVASLSKLAPKLSSPDTVTALEGLVALAPSLAQKERTEAIERLLEQLPQLSKVASWAPDAVGGAVKESGLEEADLKARVHGGTALALKLAEPKMLDQVEGLLSLAGKLDDDLDFDALGDLLGLVSKRETQDALHRLLELAPTLVPVLEALPVQPRTLELLRAVNQAVEEASLEPSPIGPIGLFRALGQPDARRASGFLVAVAQRLGAHLALPPSKRLPK